MTETSADRQRSFVLQKQITDPSRPPLEVYHLSHDLRGPLNSILGFAELLLEGIEGPLNETQEADIAAIYQSAQNLLYLINTVVDLSKLEAGRLKMMFESVDLGQLMQNVMESDLVARANQVEIVAKVAETVPAVWGDSERIAQMILSFIRFGLKSNKPGRIVITADSDDETVTIKVEIEGVVVPAEELPQLFELIVKVDPAGRSELGQGGLSLPLTRRLAEEHHGRVWVESRAGGATFYLILPVEQT